MNKFKGNLIDLRIIPNIIIFTSEKRKKSLLKKYDKEFNILKKSNNLSAGAKFGITLAIILGIIILDCGLFILWKYFKFKKDGKEFNFINLKGELVTKY